MISLDELTERYSKLVGSFIPLHTIEGEIFKNLKIVELTDLGHEVKLKVEVNL